MPAPFLSMILALLAAEPDLNGQQSAIPALLASKEARFQCWGAWRAGEEKARDAVPALRDALKTRLNGNDADSRLVRAAVLDALIQLDANAASAELRAAYPTHKVQALILLARDPQAHEQALAGLLEKDLAYRPWTAICNVLQNRRSPALTRHLMRGLKLSLNVTVFVPGEDNELIGLGGGAGGSLRGRGMLILPKDWPPRATYALTERPGGAAVLFAPGRRPIHFIRRVLRPGRNGIGRSSSHKRKTTGQRFEYLAAMLNAQPADLSVKPSRFVSVAWTNKRDLLAAVEDARRKYAADYDKLAARLVAAHVLSKEDATVLSPVFRIQFHDRRKNPVPALPTPQN